MTKEGLNSQEEPVSSEEKVNTDNVNEIETTQSENTTEQTTEDTTEQTKDRETLKLPEKKQEDSDVEVNGVKYPKELIEKAKLQGWRDKAFLESVGKENSYLDPQTFIERGEKAVPFLNKKVSKLEEEKNELTKMIQKLMADSVEDRIQNIDKQMKDAKEYNEFDNYEELVKKKTQLQTELDSYTSKKPTSESPMLPQKPIEIMDWEMKNDWSIAIFEDGRQNSNYDGDRTLKANEILNKINSTNPNIALSTKLQLVDYNLQQYYDSKQKQKANVTPPTGTVSQAISAPQKRTVEHLNASYRRIYESACIAPNGNKFTGKALEAATKSFLDACDDSAFKK